MTPPAGPAGVLLMAYGSPATLDEVEAYFTHIRGGRVPSPDAVEALKDRYRRIGGRSPLLEITRRQAAGVEALLGRQGRPARVYVGMKHAAPFIDETVALMAAEGMRRAAGLALAPHYSRMSIGGYIAAASSAASVHGIELRCVGDYHDHPGLVQALADRIAEARGLCAHGRRTPVIFTAHSLPQRILQWADPYPERLRRTCALVAAAAGIDAWQFAFQSASHTGETWLGPDIIAVLKGLHGEGVREVIVSPIGFVSDHLEVLYDIDIEARHVAGALGIRLVRAPSLNDSPDFLSVLAQLAADTLASFQVRETVQRMERPRRAPRPALAQARGYRVIIGILLAVFAVLTVVVILLAGGVLFGVIPYPGK